MKRRARKRTNKYILLIPAVIIIIAGLVFIFKNDDSVSTGARFSAKTVDVVFDDNTVISKGIYIGDTYVGGLSKFDARKKLNKEYESTGPSDVTVYWKEKEISTNLTELGASLNIEEALNKAITLSYGGGLLFKYKISMDLSASTYKIDFGKSLDREKVETFVIEKLAKIFDTEPENATISIENGAPVVSDGINGIKTMVSETVETFMESYNELSSKEKLTVTASVSTVEPEIKYGDLDCIKDVLGSYKTVYRDPDNGRTDRCTNVEVATANINGTILFPGQSVSTSDMMKERIVENGYATGGQYVNGQLEDAIGGGVCQVASTLYNALLYSEIQIDRRQNHSLLVSYVDPSRDAAIATGSKDLVFTNNLDYPIYICGITNGYQLTFTIFGKEYRQESRKIEFISTEEKRIKTEDKIVDDPELFVGETKKIGLSHDECWSKLEKVIYENGVEVSRELISEDYYMPSVATVHKGTQPLPTEPATTEAPTLEITTEAETTAEVENQH